MKIILKNEIKNGKIIWKWKRKWFEHSPIVFENYRIFEVFYRILPIEIPYSHTMPAPLLSIFLESHDSFVRTLNHNQAAWIHRTINSFLDGGIIVQIFSTIKWDTCHGWMDAWIDILTISICARNVSSHMVRILVYGLIYLSFFKISFQ